MQYVTIYNSADFPEIAIIRNLLEENDFDHVILDEATSSALGIAGLGITGVRVQVLESQREQAIALLKDRGFS